MEPFFIPFVCIEIAIAATVVLIVCLILHKPHTNSFASDVNSVATTAETLENYNRTIEATGTGMFFTL